jgi:hypothetical protein
MRDPAGSIRGARTLPRLQACLAHARRHFFPVDAILLTGDIVHDEPEAYGTIDLLFGEPGAPVLVIPGNHDVPDEMRRQLNHAPFQVGGQWRTRNGWQLLLLESWFAESTGGEGRLGDSQLQAFDRALADDTDPHALVVLHHPPVPMDSPSLDELGRSMVRCCPLRSNGIPACGASAGATRTRRSTCSGRVTCVSCVRRPPACSSRRAATSRWMTGRRGTACSTCSRTARSRRRSSGWKGIGTDVSGIPEPSVPASYRNIADTAAYESAAASRHNTTDAVT